MIVVYIRCSNRALTGKILVFWTVGHLEKRVADFGLTVLKCYCNTFRDFLSILTHTQKHLLFQSL